MLVRFLRKRLKDAMSMAKRKKSGRSARNGNAPAPYTKYEKKEHRYSAAYYEWRSKVVRKSTASRPEAYH